MDTAVSINQIPIRLTYERWYHIVENHDDIASYYHEVLETVEKPDYIINGNHKSLKAVRNSGRKKWLVVVYKEVSIVDGFIITAYFQFKKPKGKALWIHQP